MSLDLTTVSFSAPSETAPLRVSFKTTSSHQSNPIYPATQLQLSYRQDCGTEIFRAQTWSVKDIVRSGTSVASDDESDGDESNTVYSITCLPAEKFAINAAGTLEVRLHAWRREKVIGGWTVGKI